MKKITCFVCLFFLGFMGQQHLMAAEPQMSDYASLPIFTVNPVKPNILIMLDNSGSMNFNAYGSYPGNYGTVSDTPYAGKPYIPVLEKRVSASSDDSEEELSTGGSWYNNSDLDLGNFYGDSSSSCMVGVRFRDIEIPPGSEITNVYIEFTAYATATITNPMHLKVVGQDVDDAPAFDASNGDISGRTQTSKWVSWTPINAWTVNNTYQTPDLKEIVQEIVDRDGWKKGNDMAFMISYQSTSNEKRDAYPYDADSSKAPLIHIEFTQATDQKYYGYFNPDWFYTAGSKFEHEYKKVDYDTATCVGKWEVIYPASLSNPNPDENTWSTKCLSDADIVSDDLWDGNWMNWASMRRIDVARKVMMGGLASSRTGGGNQTNYGECPDQSSRIFYRVFDSSAGSAVTPFTGSHSYRFGYKCGNYATFDVDGGKDYTLAIAKREEFEPEDFHEGNVSGVLQRIGEDKAWWGNEFFYYGEGNNQEGGRIDNSIGTNLTTLITDLQNTPANTWTPLGESYYVAMQYFKQEAADSSLGYHGQAAGTINDANDPYYQDKQFVDCAKSFVLMLTDGASTKDKNIPNYLKDYDGDGNDPGTYSSSGSDYLDDIALYAHTNDLRADLDDDQTVFLYPIYAFGNDDNARDLLKDAARNGGFEDKNGNNVPDGDYSDPPEDRLEWDVNGDGDPDTYFEAQDGYVLEQKLLTAIYDILKRAASGTAVSVLSTSSEGEGNLVQASFLPKVPDSDTQWIGSLQSLWVDSLGNLREDSEPNHVLDIDLDHVINFYYDGSEVRLNRYYVSAAEPYPDLENGADETGVKLNEIEPVWEAGEVLSEMDPDDRKIFTYIDSSHTAYLGGCEFNLSNSSLVKPFLGVKDLTAWEYLGPTHDNRVDNLVQFVRGNDTGFAGYTSMRKRTMEVNGVDQVWKLGDIVYSTPVAIAYPPDNFGLIYSDESYQQFYTYHKFRNDRETMVYVGANDGMLHAFTSWKYDAASRTFSNPGFDITEAIGTELWAYIPQALLPHLKWLPRQDYTHVYYVDQKPKIADARIFYNTLGDSSSGVIDTTYHKNGWGTVLIGGLRMGGKSIDVTDDFDYNGATSDTTETFSSCYFAIDISNPRAPNLLWEKTLDGMDLTTSEPAVVKVGEKWFLVLGSGPEEYDGSSSTTGKVFVLDLATGNPYKSGSDDWLFETAESDAFMATPASLDKALNYNVDAIYIGESYDDSPKGWKGAMYKISIPWTCTAADCSTIQYGDVLNGSYDNDPFNWSISKLFYSPAPITAPPALSIDFHDNAWVYFGTGRYLSEEDKTSTDTQYLFGIKDPFFNSEHSPTGSFADNYYRNFISSLTLDTSDLFDSDVYEVIYPWGTQDTPAGDCSAVPMGQTGDISGDGSCVCDYDWPLTTCTELTFGSCAAAGVVMGEELYDDGDCVCRLFSEPEWDCLEKAGSCGSVPVAVVDDNANYHSFFYRCQEETQGDCLGVTLADIEGDYSSGGCTCTEISTLNGFLVDSYYGCTERPAGVCSNVVIPDVVDFGDEGDFYDPAGGLCRAGYWACAESTAGSGACDTVDYTLTTGFLGANVDGDYFGDGSCICGFVYDPAAVVKATTSNYGQSFDDIIDLARAEDGWMRTLVDPGERSVTKPALLGGITLFTTYVPETEICSFGGFSYLYGLYFETGTAFSSNVFDPGVNVQNGVLTIDERYYLGHGMASSVGIHVGKQEGGKAKGFVQQSTGLIRDILIDPAFNIRSGLRYWKEN